MPANGSMFLYAAAGYSAFHALLFTFSPKTPMADSFPEEVKQDDEKQKPLRVMHEVIGALQNPRGGTTPPT